MTLRGACMHSMELDLRHLDVLPKLPRDWQQWHQPGEGKEDLPLPTARLSGSALWRRNVVYVYVSDHHFSVEQHALFNKMQEKGHPWLQRVMLVSQDDTAAWHTRAGMFIKRQGLTVLADRLGVQGTSQQ